MSENGNMPAYPYIFNGHVEGLTKREVMAAMAMQSLIPLWYDDDDIFDCPAVAADACKMADALLAELERTKNP